MSRNEDASKKIFVATGILGFDFEIFIGGRCDLLATREPHCICLTVPVSQILRHTPAMKKGGQCFKLPVR